MEDEALQVGCGQMVQTLNATSGVMYFFHSQEGVIHGFVN